MKAVATPVQGTARAPSASVIGAGPAGSLAALYLARRGFKVIGEPISSNIPIPHYRGVIAVASARARQHVQVDVWEKRPPPLRENNAKQRAYNVMIGTRRALPACQKPFPLSAPCLDPSRRLSQARAAATPSRAREPPRWTRPTASSSSAPSRSPAPRASRSTCSTRCVGAPAHLPCIPCFASWVGIIPVNTANPKNTDPCNADGIDRLEVVRHLVAEAQRLHPGAITFHYEHAFEGVDLASRRLLLAQRPFSSAAGEPEAGGDGGELLEVGYDLLLGADGAGSLVRAAMAQQGAGGVQVGLWLVATGQ
jgi:hypothetical protein